MSFSYTFGSCLDKIMYYVRGVALEDIKVIYKKKEYIFPKYDSIKFGPSFFRDFPCEVCGKCCKDFLQIFLKSEYSKNEWKSNDEMIVNGKKVSIHIKEHKLDEKCRFLTEDNKGVKRFCSIHNSYGITCHAPHRAPKVINGICVWIKRAYGRQWIKPPEKRCPGKPYIEDENGNPILDNKGNKVNKEYTLDEIDSDILFFIHLRRVCNDLGIKNCSYDLILIIKKIREEKLRLKVGRLF